VNGLWNYGLNVENVDQPHSRHKCIVVNTGGLPFNPQDVSGFMSTAPGVGFPAVASPRVPGAFEGGPHFIMSPTTPDGRPTLGFEFGLFGSPAMPVVSQATPIPAGFTIIPWVLVDTLYTGPGLNPSFWMAMAPVTGVFVNQLFSSFDINSSAIRFQVDPATIAAPGSLGIAFCEL
jgi:hypothetical protein